MDFLIQISKLNDFCYSPESLYLHLAYEDFTTQSYQQNPQKIGKLNHQSIDKQTHSKIWQGTSIFSHKYGLVGKLDTYNPETGELIERKTTIKTIYLGYKLQLWAQYLCLIEMGQNPQKLVLYSLSTNQKYDIGLPNQKDIETLTSIIQKIQSFTPKDLLDLSDHDPHAEVSIYSPLDY